MSESSSSSISADAARRTARNIGAIALAQIVSKGALFVWQLVLIPLLGKSAYGIYTTVTAFFLVGVAVASFGMGNIVIREVARRTSLAGKYLGATLFYQTILALVAYLGINAVAALGDYTPEVRGFVALAGLSLFVDQLGTMVYEQLLAREQMVTTSLVEIGTVIVRIVLTALALVAGWGLVGVYAATILSGLARALVLWRALLADGVRPEFPLDRALVRNLFADATPLALAAFVNQAYTQLDRLVTGRFIPEGVAYLGAAFIIIVGMVELLSTTVLIAVFPIMSRTYSENPAVFRALVSRLAFYTLLIVLPITLVLSIFAHTFTLVFGADFLPTADILRVLVWYALLAMVANVFAQALLVQNQQRITLGVRAAGLTINLGLLLFLLPRFGVRGAPLATASAEALVLLALVWLFWRLGRGDAPVIRAGQIARLLIAGGLAAAAMLALGGVNFVLGIAGGLLIYAIAVLVLRVLHTDDWALLRRLIEAMPGGALIARWLPTP